MRAAAAVLLLLATPVQAASYMVGTWFGHGQPEDKSALYIDRMRPDGTWRGEYRTCLRGKESNQVQIGRWSLTGDILSLKIDSVDGVPQQQRIDIYKMLAHDAHSQKYVSSAWHFAYTPQRVADDFQMPSCELTS